MILQTYQSMAVLSILKKDQVYRAKPSLSFKGEYAALIDMLDIDCECPIFAVVKGRKQKTGGRVSGAIMFTLAVPDDKIKLTEYGTWADFLYAYKFSKPHDYTRLNPDSEEMSHRKYSHIMQSLKTQRPLGKYKYPQAIIEEIKPEWLVQYKLIPPGTRSGAIDLAENLANIFRK